MEEEEVDEEVEEHFEVVAEDAVGVEVLLVLGQLVLLELFSDQAAPQEHDQVERNGLEPEQTPAQVQVAGHLQGVGQVQSLGGQQLPSLLVTRHPLPHTEEVGRQIHAQQQHLQGLVVRH